MIPEISETLNIAIIAAYVLANIADVVTTDAVLRDGRGIKGNPIVAWIMDRIGVGWIVVKLAVAGGAGWAIYTYGAIWMLGALAVLIGAVAWQNTRVGR